MVTLEESIKKVNEVIAKDVDTSGTNLRKPIHGSGVNRSTASNGIAIKTSYHG